MPDVEVAESTTAPDRPRRIVYSHAAIPDVVAEVGAGVAEGVTVVASLPVYVRLDSVNGEIARLREAITDALADLEPGYAPHGLLTDALTGQDQEAHNDAREGR